MPNIAPKCFNRKTTGRNQILEKMKWTPTTFVISTGTNKETENSEVNPCMREVLMQHKIAF